MPTVMITGATRGIGFELARQYLDDDWTVYATCRDQKGRERLGALQRNGRLNVFDLDVTDTRRSTVSPNSSEDRPSISCSTMQAP
jgi:NAD(P)-dependent dehydrogenase (short-subunit alcohol dehydrogenase family)